MMTGIPPPRMFNHSWQVSRMCDKGFYDYIKPIIQDMLQTDPTDWPTGMTLVDLIDVQWRKWRANTRREESFLTWKIGRLLTRLIVRMLRLG
jgi:hypothetical protein